MREPFSAVRLGHLRGLEKGPTQTEQLSSGHLLTHFCSLNYECIIVNVQYGTKWTFFVACARVCAHWLFSRGRGGRQSTGQHRQEERRFVTKCQEQKSEDQLCVTWGEGLRVQTTWLPSGSFPQDCLQNLRSPKTLNRKHHPSNPAPWGAAAGGARGGGRQGGTCPIISQCWQSPIWARLVTQTLWSFSSSFQDFLEG